MLSEKLQEVSRDAMATEAVVTTTTQLFSRADGPFVQVELRLHPEMDGTGLLRGDYATEAREQEIRMMDDGGVDYVGVTMFSGHGATAVSDAVARRDALASAGVGVEMWLSITQIMKAKKQSSFEGTKALNQHLLKASAKKIVVVDCYFGETHHRADEERHIFNVRNYAPPSYI